MPSIEELMSMVRKANEGERYLREVICRLKKEHTEQRDRDWELHQRLSTESIQRSATQQQEIERLRSRVDHLLALGIKAVNERDAQQAETERLRERLEGAELGERSADQEVERLRGVLAEAGLDLNGFTKEDRAAIQVGIEQANRGETVSLEELVKTLGLDDAAQRKGERTVDIVKVAVELGDAVYAITSHASRCELRALADGILRRHLEPQGTERQPTINLAEVDSSEQLERAKGLLWQVVNMNPPQLPQTVKDARAFLQGEPHDEREVPVRAEQGVTDAMQLRDPATTEARWNVDQRNDGVEPDVRSSRPEVHLRENATGQRAEPAERKPRLPEALPEAQAVAPASPVREEEVRSSMDDLGPIEAVLDNLGLLEWDRCVPPNPCFRLVDFAAVAKVVEPLLAELAALRKRVEEGDERYRKISAAAGALVDAVVTRNEIESLSQFTCPLMATLVSHVGFVPYSDPAMAATPEPKEPA